MASLSAKSLKRVTEGRFGPVGALKADCDDFGSIRSVEITPSWDTLQATDAAYGDMPVAEQRENYKYTMTIECEDVVARNIALGMGGEEQVDGSIHFNGTADPEYFTVYLEGFEYYQNPDPTVVLQPAEWHVLKVALNPSEAMNLGKVDGGRTIMLSFNIYVVPDATTDYKIMALYPSSVDTTPPTVSSTTPADAATGVSVSGDVVFNFSEAIKTEDVTGRNFFILNASTGAVVAATVTKTDADTVTINPDSNLSASTAYIAVATTNVRDVAGNHLAAQAVVNFTTA